MTTSVKISSSEPCRISNILSHDIDGGLKTRRRKQLRYFSETSNKINQNMHKGKKNVDQLKHPNSRKTNSLIKKMKRNEKKEEKKLGTHIKQNLIGEKVLWFKERIPENCSMLSKEQTFEMIENYLARFDDEVEQIELKNSVGIRKNRQHMSRLDVINMSKERERQEFESCGLEMPDLLDATQVQVLKEWNGELRFLSHFRFKRIAKKHLVSS